MKKTMLALAALSVLGASATPAFAGDRDSVSRRELQQDRQKVREERREYRNALRYGDRGDIREERRELRAAERELREDQRDMRRYRDNNGRYYGDSAYYRGDRGRAPQGWYGRDDRNDRRCRDSDTNGTILGAVAGGALGNVIAKDGNKALGTVIGAGLGGVLGNRIDHDGRGGRRC